MGMRIPWLEMTSKQEQHRREEKARQLMFPFGEPQRAAELQLLRELIGTRSRDTDILFQLFQAKDCLRRREDEDPEEQNGRLWEWLHSQLARAYTPEERMRFLALAELEQGMQHLQDLPDAAAICRRATELCAEKANYLE